MKPRGGRFCTLELYPIAPFPLHHHTHSIHLRRQPPPFTHSNLRSNTQTMSLATSGGAGAGLAGGGLSAAAMAHGGPNAALATHTPPHNAQYSSIPNSSGAAAPPGTSYAALGADLLDKNQSFLNGKNVRGVSALPIVGVDLYGDGCGVGYFGPMEKEEDGGKGVFGCCGRLLLYCIGWSMLCLFGMSCPTISFHISCTARHHCVSTLYTTATTAQTIPTEAKWQQ